MKETEIITPCFVLEVEKLRDNICKFKEALDSRFKFNILGYSIKTNSTPILLDYILEYGCYAEVVSYTEYNLSISKGFTPDRIIYNGPLKDENSFIEAITNGGHVNIDTKRELQWLLKLPHNKTYGVGLRVNLNLMQISPEDCKDGEEYSRFGFSEENGEFADALNFISQLPNVQVVGLHLHRTSKTRSLEVYRNIVRYASELARKYKLELEYIDVGGGYYGDMPGKPTYTDYVNAIADELSSHFDCNTLELIVEPGNAIIASPYSFYSSVIDSKIIKDDQILILDGSRNDIDPFFHKSDYYKTFLLEIGNRELMPKQVFVGCTCLENDRLFTLLDSPRIEVGDVIKFHYVGAYTTCISPLFIRYFPRVYVRREGDYQLVHEEWTSKEYLR